MGPALVSRETFSKSLSTSRLTLKVNGKKRQVADFGADMVSASLISD
jgi:hypothetical protein